jgi:16S rRNA (guanine527-N7)-methyltransferase
MNLKHSDTEQKSSGLAAIEHAFDMLFIKQDDAKRQKLYDYACLIVKWNKTYNLTALKKIDDVYEQHIFDSLATINPINQYLKQQHIEQAQIFDIGSGAGLPGVVIAIMCPQISVVCVDAVGKKVAFLQHVANTLGLINLNAQHQRVESWNTKPADLVISRAFSSLYNFTSWSGIHVKEKGQMIAMKAHLLPAELTEFETQPIWQISHIEKLVVPNLDATRCLVWINKKGTT